MDFLKKLLKFVGVTLFLLFCFSFIAKTTLAEITKPLYTIDYKPQVLFGDSIQIGGYQGLENYLADYVGGYLHISYTISHGSGYYASFPALINIFSDDPSVFSNTSSLFQGGANSFGQTDFYFIDIQFSSAGYHEIVTEGPDHIPFSDDVVSVSGMDADTFIALANQHPMSDPPAPSSMSFQPMRLVSVAPTKILSFNISKSAKTATVQGHIAPDDVGSGINFTASTSTQGQVYASSTIYPTTSGDFFYTWTYPVSETIKGSDDFTFYTEIVKDKTVLKSKSITMVIETPIIGYPGYSNPNNDASQGVANSLSHFAQTLGTNLSGTLTRVDLDTSNGSYDYYASRPFFALYECDDATYGGFIATGSVGCPSIYSGISDDTSQLTLSTQSLYPDSIVLNPSKYYVFVTRGNNGFFALPTSYGSGQDEVDGSCYSINPSSGISPCTNIADLYFRLYGISKVVQPPVPSHNPVLIIPGVLGTEISKGTNKLWLDLVHNTTDIGDNFMDALQFNSNLAPSDLSLTIGDVLGKILTYDYSDGLVKEFQNQGYVEGTDLFLFPYDWRYGVSANIISQLQKKIQDIKTQTGADKVDVVAHSTGGLLVKKYVMDNSANNYIGKAVFVGVPNTGAPKAIKALVHGDSFSVPFLADSEMKKIAANMPVVYDLSPSLKYFNIKGSYIKVVKEGILSTSSEDLDFHQSNSFLTDDHKLNSQALTDAQNLHTIGFDNYDLRAAGVDLYAIDGCKTGTISKIVEHRFLGNTFISYEAPEESPGDGTVPLESATNLPIDQDHKYYGLKSTHSEMLTEDGSRQEIVNLVSGSSLGVPSNLITQDISKCKLNGKAISVFSPLDIDIKDQNGNHSGVVSGGVENNIPNADFEIMGEHKFVYLPSDEGQIYTIKIKGTGSGTFTIKDQDILDNKVSKTEVFSNIPVTTSLSGNIIIGDITTLSLDNNGDGTTDQIMKPSSTTNTDQSKDLISPITTSTISGTLGQTSFYRSNVSIKLLASDPVILGQETQTSGILKTVYKLDNDSGYTEYLNPVAVSTEGLHILRFFSTDKAGNNETEKSVKFVIDKTPPEFVIQFSAKVGDLLFLGIDNMPTARSISVLDQDDVITIADQSGNITQIKLKDKDRKHKFKGEIKSLTYNNQQVDITKNALAFDWNFNKQQNLSALNQHVKSKKDFHIDATYDGSKTTITGKDQNGKINKTLNGLILLKISTDKGDLNWSF
ncbi:MAG: hypothetical protein WCI76_03005 [bacterium]